MAQPTDDTKNATKTGGEASGSRRTKRRTRSLLNLGVPFVQLDDILNQSEDAVALGYRVLEDTVEEIKRGYEQAKEFNRRQTAFENGTEPAPTVPWVDLVERVQALQNIAFRSMKSGTEIFFDSIRSGTGAVKSVARTFEQSSDDLGAKPRMAGPVFDELLTIRVIAGQQLEPHKWEIAHRGLARLRIHVQLKPELRQLEKAHVKSDAPLSTLKEVSVSFAPKGGNDQEFSELVVNLGKVPEGQPPGDYEGIVKATNFELLIARLRVTVDGAKKQPSAEPRPGRVRR